MAGPELIQRWAATGGVGRARSPYQATKSDAGTVEAGVRVVRVAFAGRTSTDDQQDPTLSLPRQLRSVQRVLPDHAVIVAHFYDVESGRTDLALRGRGHAHEAFDIPIPRDGGLQDLLAEADRPDRRFDVVMCEGIDRISRRTYYGTMIEHRLEQVGVLLVAADEPFTLDPVRGRTRTATQVLTRRVKQGVSEWYVRDMLEKSWDGTAVHTELGYNIGKPCYGYTARRVPHPVPAKRAKGAKKTYLDPDPLQAPVVRRIFGWRVAERLGYQSIADRLNADLATNPPPTPVDPTRAVGRWTASNVREAGFHKAPNGSDQPFRAGTAGGRGDRVAPGVRWWTVTVVAEALPTRPQPAGVASSRPSAGLERGDRWIRWTTTASVVLLAGIAAVVSYRHMHTLALAHGESSWTATLLPLSVDGMVVASSMTLLADSRVGRSGGLLPWALLAVASAASLGANVAVAEPTGYGRVIAAWPSFALIGAYELLMRQVRQGAVADRVRQPGVHRAAGSVGPGAVGMDSWPPAAATTRPSSDRSGARRRPERTSAGRGSTRRVDAGLLARARQIDAETWRQRGRPASAETLRVALGVGAGSARQLKDLIRQAPVRPSAAPPATVAG